MNYYENYLARVQRLYEQIHASITSLMNTPDEDALQRAASTIVQDIQKDSYDISHSKMDIALSLKPTKRSSDTIQFIQDYYLKDQSLTILEICWQDMQVFLRIKEKESSLKISLTVLKKPSR